MQLEEHSRLQMLLELFEAIFSVPVWRTGGGIIDRWLKRLHCSAVMDKLRRIHSQHFMPFICDFLPSPDIDVYT